MRGSARWPSRLRAGGRPAGRRAGARGQGRARSRTATGQAGPHRDRQHPVLAQPARAGGGNTARAVADFRVVAHGGASCRAGWHACRHRLPLRGPVRAVAASQAAGGGGDDACLPFRPGLQPFPGAVRFLSAGIGVPGLPGVYERRGQQSPPVAARPWLACAGNRRHGGDAGAGPRSACLSCGGRTDRQRHRCDGRHPPGLCARQAAHRRYMVPDDVCRRPDRRARCAGSASARSSDIRRAGSGDQSAGRHLDLASGVCFNDYATTVLDEGERALVRDLLGRPVHALPGDEIARIEQRHRFFARGLLALCTPLSASHS